MSGGRARTLGVELIRQGKVREVYADGDDVILVASDRVSVYDVAEARRLLAAVHGTRHEALFTVMLSFGLRRGEALGLHWSAMSWEAGTLKVTPRDQARLCPCG